MKKGISILVLLVLVSVGAFAQSNVGLGFIFDYSGGNGVLYEEANDSIRQSLNNTSFGGYIFYDYKYLETSIYLNYGMLNGETALTLMGSTTTTPFMENTRALQMGISFIGKFPINLGSITIFPMAGVDFNMVLTAADENIVYTDAEDLSQFGLLGGAGIDYNLSDTMFIRISALFHLRFSNKLMRDLVDYYNYLLYVTDFETTLGLGAQVKVGIGWKR